MGLLPSVFSHGKFREPLPRSLCHADGIELVEELEDQAREMPGMVEARWQAEGL